MNQSPLSHFHPLVQRWFTENVGPPTAVQAQAWPRIAAGEHLLITAPTGSGKTLTAFLWALHQLISTAWPTDRPGVLYVSPLKALNNDIQRNLLTPLRELRRVFEEAGKPFPDIRVLTRSGDTPQSERRKMLRQPPAILITTPESFNLLLSSRGGRSLLGEIRTVILDEIHAVIGGKRGTHLITAVERLVPLAGEFQRLALSATVRPLETVAEFVGGFSLAGDPAHPRYAPRPVTIMQSPVGKLYEVTVRFPETPLGEAEGETFWDPMVAEFKKIIHRNRSTLLFTNSRRLCENLTFQINQGESQPLAYAHHGSLSRQIRETVEAKLKAGELKAIVATSSLEMGIDIGALDEVVLIQSPSAISAAIQRIGRAGHQVGEVSRGTIFPTHPRDFLDAAVLAESVLSQDIEAVQAVEAPLDVLAQVIISMVGMETWDIDALYARLRASYPYRRLGRSQFEQVLNMLAGRYADTQIRDLKARISLDRLDNTVTARPGALQALYLSGGTIPDRGYFHLRHLKSRARIGELDEEFVWENGVGSTFTLGTQTWRVEKVTHNDVLVLPGNPHAPSPPFWKAEENSRDFHFSERIGEFLEKANQRLDDPAFAAELRGKHQLDESAAEQLLTFLRSQREVSGCDLPHRHHLLIEHVDAAPGGAPGNQLILHTFWGGKVNRPLAMALQGAWEERFQVTLEVYPGDDAIFLLLPEDRPGEDILGLVSSERLPELLRAQLEGSGFFGARFRECAGRALLLGRSRMTERLPLWMSRLRSQKLLSAVMKYDDFPILLETWRTCLQDAFELEKLQQLLGELESGQITWSETHTRQASPFAQTVSWRQINQYMYMDDRLQKSQSSRLRSDLLREVVFSPGLRPAVPEAVVKRFEAKRQRLSPGYAPQPGRDLVEWVKERLLITSPEWERLLEAIRRDHQLARREVERSVEDKLVRLHPSSAAPLVAARESLPRLWSGFYDGDTGLTVEILGTGSPKRAALPEDEPELFEREELFTELLGEWLQFYGPREAEWVSETLGIAAERLQPVLEDLIDAQTLITGELVEESESALLCDSENFEILLRMMRAEAAPAFDPREVEHLPLFLAHQQGLTRPREGVEGLLQTLEQLSGYPAEAGMWEAEILPARIEKYLPTLLDQAMLTGELRWIGQENRHLVFCFAEDRDLLQKESDDNAGGDEVRNSNEGDGSDASDSGRREFSLFPDPRGRYDFSTLLRSSRLSAAQLAERLWEAVWSGLITNDTFAVLRQGIQNRFKMPEVGSAASRRGGRSARRALFAKWKGAAPFAGNWFQLPELELSDDLLESEERRKERVRILLDRYGILFRELLSRELPAFRWSEVFRSLRLMELSGEVLSGYFFQGIPGPQFMAPAAFRQLQRGLPDEAAYWLNAADPASLCGVPLEGLRGNLPRRLAGTYLVYRGRDIALIVERNGKALSLFVRPDDPRLAEYLEVLRHLLTRSFQPLRRIAIETINETPAPNSPYLTALQDEFETSVDYKQVVLYRRW